MKTKFTKESVEHAKYLIANNGICCFFIKCKSCFANDKINSCLTSIALKKAKKYIERWEKMIKIAKLIIKQDGYCYGISCYQCPIYDDCPSIELIIKKLLLAKDFLAQFEEPEKKLMWEGREIEVVEFKEGDNCEKCCFYIECEKQDKGWLFSKWENENKIKHCKTEAPFVYYKFKTNDMKYELTKEEIENLSEISINSKNYFKDKFPELFKSKIEFKEYLNYAIKYEEKIYILINNGNNEFYWQNHLCTKPFLRFARGTSFNDVIEDFDVHIFHLEKELYKWCYENS